MEKRILGLASLVLCLFLISAGVLAAYPDKPIQLIVPWGAGGRTDVNARMFATFASKYLAQPMVVVNKPGGGSVIGGDLVAKAKPDGLTLLTITPGTNIFPPIFSKTPYGPFDFEPIGQIGSGTMEILAQPGKWKNVRELIADAKKRPGEITYTCVALKAPQLGFLRWAEKAGLKFKFVPAQDDNAAITTVLGGHVGLVMNSSVASAMPHIKGNKLVALLAFSEKRDPNLPDAPTARELGYDVVASPFTGIAGPKGMDKAVVDKLAEVFKKVMQDPEFIQKMNAIGEDLNPKYGQEFFQIWKNEYEENLAIAKKLGVKN